MYLNPKRPRLTKLKEKLKANFSIELKLIRFGFDFGHEEIEANSIQLIYRTVFVFYFLAKERKR